MESEKEKENFLFRKGTVMIGLDFPCFIVDGNRPCMAASRGTMLLLSTINFLVPRSNSSSLGVFVKWPCRQGGM